MAVTARQNEHQTTHFIRANVVWNQAGATAIQVSTGSAIPANAVVTRIAVNVHTAFNGTTPTLDVGTAAAPTALVSGQAVTAVGANAVLPATLGGLLSSTVDLELFTRVNFGGTPSAGAATVVIEYAPNI